MDEPQMSAWIKLKQECFYDRSATIYLILFLFFFLLSLQSTHWLVIIWFTHELLIYLEIYGTDFISFKKYTWPDKFYYFNILK